MIFFVGMCLCFGFRISPTSSDDASFKAIDFDFNSPPANVPIARDIRIRLSGKLRDAILDLIEICGDGTYKQVTCTRTYKKNRIALSDRPLSILTQVARVFLSNEELKESTQILVSRYVWRGCTEGKDQRRVRIFLNVVEFVPIFSGQYLFRLDSAPFDGKTRQQTKVYLQIRIFTRMQRVT